MDVPLFSNLLVTWITIVSPQSPVKVGPGMVPLKARPGRVNPSGETVVFSTVNQYLNSVRPEDLLWFWETHFSDNTSGWPVSIVISVDGIVSPAVPRCRRVDATLTSSNIGAVWKGKRLIRKWSCWCERHQSHKESSDRGLHGEVRQDSRESRRSTSEGERDYYDGGRRWEKQEILGVLYLHPRITYSTRAHQFPGEPTGGV
jgi:hypothetical protein